MHPPSPLETIFFEALEKGSPEDRAAYLDQACAGDAELRGRVERMLSAQSDAGSFLESPAAEVAAPHFAATIDMPPIAERPGTVIGSYKLLEQIGEGGFGVVFMAEQQQPVRRKVALKVIKPGMDTRQVIARFEAERQALAVMDHPNIAHVLEAGTTQSGRPYFVMELVRGVPITAYCDKHNLPVRERLELFASVCQAIQHAHTKGIIHRDIKPGNVLVTRQDGRPIVKVIDFGVAKAMGPQLTEKTLFTEFAQIVGTPLYMSPEQAELSSVDIDTRSDIYSLGVLLYELLTGSTPVGKEQLTRAGFDEIRRIIREDEPLRPSVRISTSETLPAIAAHRHIEPARLSGLVRGELDWIVMKSLEKDRNRRYETANGFALDVQRHLADEPVLACPPSNWYRFRKLARRNRTACVAAAAAVLIVLLGTGALAVSNYLIRLEQARTRDEQKRTEAARQLAERRAEEIRQSLERLKAANGWLERGRWSVAMRHWDEANAAFSKAVELRPEHAAAWVERGDQFAWLGLWDLASADFAREFELGEPDQTMRWYRYALLRLFLDDMDAYHQVRDRMRERFHGTLEKSFATEVVRTCILGSDSDEMESLVELAQQAADRAPAQWYELYILGIAQYRAGHFEQAALRLRESLTASCDAPLRAISYPVLAMAHYRRGEPAAAREALLSAADAIERWTAELYQTPPGSHWVVDQGAGPPWPIAWWDWLECRLYYREAKLLIDGTPPPDDPRLHVLRARAFAGLRRNFTADREYAAILQRWPDDPQVRMEACRSAGYSAVGRGQWRTAAAEFARACELEPDDSYLWRYRAVACLAAGDVDAYRQACATVLERFETTEDPATAGNVLLICVLRGDALTETARLLPLTRVADRLWHWGDWARGAALYRAGRFDECVRCFETAAKIYRPRAWDWCFLAMAHHHLGHTDEARRCLAEANHWIDEANRQSGEDLISLRPSWGNWHEPVAYLLLLREAEELLKTEPAVGKPQTAEQM